MKIKISLRSNEPGSRGVIEGEIEMIMTKKSMYFCLTFIN